MIFALRRLSLVVGGLCGAMISSAAVVAKATETRRIEVEDAESPDENAQRANANANDGPATTMAGSRREWVDDAPGPMEAPQLRNVEPRTRIYMDGTFAQTTDLSALPHIAGSGRNLRGAIGGSLKWRRFQFDIELPAAQATTVDLLDPDPGTVILESDRHQTSLSIGDLRLGAQWTHALPLDALPLSAGFGVRVRAPTHTTFFQFYNELDGSTITYALPYYFHIEPTVMVGGALGPLSFVMNQGALVLIGPDGNIGDLPIRVPTLYFWDAHYALALRMVKRLSVSFEVNTTMQLNQVGGLDFQKLNNVFALAVAPGLQLHLGRYRVDLGARFGLTEGAELMGVVAFAGTRSFMVRLGRVFD